MAKIPSSIDIDYVYDFLGSLIANADIEFHTERCIDSGMLQVVAAGCDPVITGYDVQTIVAQLARIINWIRTLPQHPADDELSN